MLKKKRLFFDIETSPNVGLFWTAGYKQKISYENIIKEREIICICYKWEGYEKVYSLQWDSKQSDKRMLTQFINVANEADEMVGHNGDKFDLAWIRTRCLFHQIPMFPTYTTIDTLKQARAKFKFNSNRLDYIAKYLGLPGKIHTGFDLWKGIVLDKDKECMSKMVEYCKFDVELLEKVFERLSPHIVGRLHHGMLNGAKKHSCTNCGGYDMKISKTRITAAGYKKHQLQCNECGKYTTVADNNLKHY